MGWISDKLARVFGKHSPSRMKAKVIEKNMDAYLECFEEGLRRGKNEAMTFPWDSIIVGIGDDGFPVYDSAYSENEIRDVMKGNADTSRLTSDLKDALGIDRDKVDETKEQSRG